MSSILKIKTTRQIKRNPRRQKTVLVKALEHQPQRIKCSITDHLILFTPASVAFCYQIILPEALFIQSLQKVLADFPVFAGILVKINHHFYIDCINQGVTVDIEQVNQSLAFEPVGFQIETEKLIDKINIHRAFMFKKSLLNIKLRYYRNGMTIGYSWSHGLCDMSGLLIFLKAISLCVQGKPYQIAHFVEDRDTFLKAWMTQYSASTFGERYTALRMKHLFHYVKHFCTPKQALHLYLSPEEIEKLRGACGATTDRKFSRNDMISAYILQLIATCCEDKTPLYRASLIINYLSRLGVTSAPLGNYLDTVPITFKKYASFESIAANIRDEIEHYLERSFCQLEVIDYFNQHKGSRKMFHKFPSDFIPDQPQIVVSNLTKMEAYSIDFGLKAPYLMLPLTDTFFPWLSIIVEGYDNQGALIYLLLPKWLSKRVCQCVS